MSECCANCKYCEYSPKDGKNAPADWYCRHHRRWLGYTGGKCRDYEAK